MKVRSERLNKKFGDCTRISTLQKIKDETKKYMNEAEKYMNEAEKYRDELLNLTNTSNTCITKDPVKVEKISEDPVIDEKISKDPAFDDIDSIDEKISKHLVVIGDKKVTEDPTIDNDNGSIHEKITEDPVFNDDTWINMFKITRNDIVDVENNYEKRRIIWIFWKSHVSELCEKWICSEGNYAYTRFEEFRTYNDEVIFTNEHKAVLTKKEALRYIDANNLNILKDFCSDSKTVFKDNKPFTAELIEMINAKNINDHNTKTLKKSTQIIDAMYYSLLKTISNIETDRAKIFDIFNICHRTDDVELKIDISQKVITIHNNLFDVLWNISGRKDKRCIKKAKKIKSMIDICMS